MDKLVVNPSDVRGHGNIIEQRNRTNFIRFHSELLDGSETVTLDNLPFTFFHMKLEGLPILVNIDFPDLETLVLGESCTINGIILLEDETPVPDIVMSLYVDEVYKTSGTTNNEGEVSVTYTPIHIGVTRFRFEVLSQNQYAEGDYEESVSIGFSMNISSLLRSVDFDNTGGNDSYVLNYSTVDSRDTLTNEGFVSNIYIARGGESVTDVNGDIYTAIKGDILIEYTTLPNRTESNILFEEDVSLLTGAISNVNQGTGKDKFKFNKVRYDDDYLNFKDSEG